MPTYSYSCTACGHKFDAVQAFTDDALTTCPECSGRLRKLFNSVGVVFKGSGFYRTDSRDSGKTPASGSSGESAKSPSGSESTTAGASESKTSDSKSSSSAPSGSSSTASATAG